MASISLSRFSVSDVTPLSISRGRGFGITPVPFSLGDHQVGVETTFGEDPVYGPFKCRNVVTPPSQPIADLHIPVL